MGTQQKKKKRTKDNRAVVAEIKRTQDLDANRLALQPTFEGTAYATIGAGTISFCNVNTTIVGGTQTNANPPGQVTGLSVSAISNSQLNLSWTVVASINYYNIYRSDTSGSGFTLLTTSLTNSYSDTGLIAGTTYYYKVGAVNDMGEGTLSAQAQGTTTGTAPTVTPNLWLALNGNYTDSAGLNPAATYTDGGNGNTAFGSPGKFGSNFHHLNYPNFANISKITLPHNSNIALDYTNGFSFSLWFWPESGTTGSLIPTIFAKLDDANNWVWVYLDGNFVTGHFVKPSGPGLRTTAGFFNFGAWNHLVITHDGTLPRIYLDKVLNNVAASASGYGIGITTPLSIGQNPGSTNPNMTFRGRIDEFQYFKGVVLTQTQVNNLFATNAP